MKRSELEKHIGESVEVKLFDGDTMQGVLRKQEVQRQTHKPLRILTDVRNQTQKTTPTMTEGRQRKKPRNKNEVQRFCIDLAGN